jgi:hypothetical protein
MLSRRKEPPASAGGFLFLDRSSIESEVFFPSKIHDVKLERYSTSLHTFVFLPILQVSAEKFHTSQMLKPVLAREESRLY